MLLAEQCVGTDLENIRQEGSLGKILLITGAQPDRLIQIPQFKLGECRVVQGRLGDAAASPFIDRDKVEFGCALPQLKVGLLLPSRFGPISEEFRFPRRSSHRRQQRLGRRVGFRRTATLQSRLHQPVGRLGRVLALAFYSRSEPLVGFGIRLGRQQFSTREQRRLGAARRVRQAGHFKKGLGCRRMVAQLALNQAQPEKGLVTAGKTLVLQDRFQLPQRLDRQPLGLTLLSLVLGAKRKLPQRLGCPQTNFGQLGRRCRFLGGGGEKLLVVPKGEVKLAQLLVDIGQGKEAGKAKCLLGILAHPRIGGGSLGQAAQLLKSEPLKIGCLIVVAILRILLQLVGEYLRCGGQQLPTRLSLSAGNQVATVL